MERDGERRGFFSGEGLLRKVFYCGGGKIIIISEYTRAGDYKAASLGIGKPLRPRMLRLSLGRSSGTTTFVGFRYCCPWSF